MAVLLSLLALFAGPSPARPVGAPDSTAARVVAAARRALAERFPDAAARLQVRVERLSPDLADGSGPLRVSFTEAEMPRALSQVSVLLCGSDGNWSKAGWALVYVAHFDSVVTPLQMVRAGEELDADAVAFSWIETTRLPGTTLSPAAFRVLARSGPVFAARHLRQDQVLRPGEVRGALAAETGGAVEMALRRGTLVLRVPCRAREAGSVGDVVRLHAPSTGRIYRARLTAPGEADWVETL